MRAYTCYVQTGDFLKASSALDAAISLGDETAAKNKNWLGEHIKYEEFSMKAIAKRDWHEARFYLKRILESATDSCKHTCLLLEVFVTESPNDMTDSVSYTTKVQNQFIEMPEFLFWRGRILIYNGQVDIGKKHIKQALSVDPDCAKYMKFWKGIQKADKTKESAAESFKNGDIPAALTMYDECLQFDALNNSFNMTILYNKACALAKVSRNDEALDTL